MFLIWLQIKTNEKFIKRYYVNVNVNLMEENVIEIKSGITVDVDANVKNIIYMKKIISGILLHIFAKIVNI